MKSSLAALDQGYADAKSAAEEYAPTVDDIRKKADDARQAHSDLADSLVEMNSEAGAEAGALQSYVDTVDELAHEVRPHLRRAGAASRTRWTA